MNYMDEAARIIGGGLVALAVAAISVRLALNRYKREKLWDKKLAVYSDIVVGLTEMKSLIADWLFEAEVTDAQRPSESYEPFTDPSDSFWTRYNASFAKFESAFHLANLIVPDAIYSTLFTLHRDIERLLGSPEIWPGDYQGIFQEILTMISDRLEVLPGAMKADLDVGTGS